MTEEKEVVPETNGEGKEKEESNGKEIVEEKSETEEPSAEATEKENDDMNLHDAIIRQVEYYFGDVNLPRDKFLREQVKLDDGWVPLEVLMKFNRLSKLTTDVDLIVKALNKSKSGLLEVTDTKVRRHPENPVPELNEDRRKQLLARTIYVKGFPKDSNLDELLKHFKQFEEVENLIMRRYLDKRTMKRMFKGSIFVTFKSRDQAEAFMDTKDLKYKEASLITLWQEDYVKQKQEEHDTRKEKKDKKKDKPPADEKPEFKLPTGTVLFFGDAHEQMTREDVKTAILQHDEKAEIAYIDFKVGLTQGWVRFVKEDAATQYIKLLHDGKLKVGEYTLAIRALHGEEEKAYLDKSVEEMTKRRKNQKNFKQNKGRGNGYKGKFGKKRRQGDHDDAPPSKVKADS